MDLVIKAASVTATYRLQLIKTSFSTTAPTLLNLRQENPATAPAAPKIVDKNPSTLPFPLQIQEIWSVSMLFVYFKMGINSLSLHYLLDYLVTIRTD